MRFGVVVHARSRTFSLYLCRGLALVHMLLGLSSRSCQVQAGHGRGPLEQRTLTPIRPMDVVVPLLFATHLGQFKMPLDIVMEDLHTLVKHAVVKLPCV